MREWLQEGLARLEEGLALEPDHPKAFPSACAMRFQLDGDIAHLVRLADWWREHPHYGYADNMLTRACYMRTWLAVVPPAGEAVASVLRQFAETQKTGESRVGGMTSLALSALEAPSALSVLRSVQPGIRLTGSSRVIRLLRIRISACRSPKGATGYGPTPGSRHGRFRPPRPARRPPRSGPSRPGAIRGILFVPMTSPWPCPGSA